MKKLLVTMCVALLSIGAQAQEKGDFALGVHSGTTYTKVELFNEKEKMTQFGFGAFAQYNLTNKFRVELEGNYHPMKKHMSDFLLGLNVHYLFNIDENLKIYPLLGYALAFVHSETYTEGNITVQGDNTTDHGLQVGAGIQFDLGNSWFLAGEYKFQPGIFANSHVFLIGIGYRF
ncbi:MAG: porin family protein [Prevotella sp.]|nr:porin family protein [Prevotella sp.]MBP5506939.1 porin family protein [Prevotella sp.]